jgi:3-dehydroquinate dehydratase / shikimate dehydrogenase
MATNPRVCVTVTAPTMAVLRERRDAATGADLVELRLDGVRDPDVAGALAGRRVPVLVTCRPTWEGGAFRGAEEERHHLLAEAQARGAEFIDVEWRAGFTDLISATGGRGVVVSHHDFSGVPADLGDRLRAMRATGAEVVKLAVQARRLDDCLALLDAGRAFGEEGGLVLLAMGPAGIMTRVLAARFQCRWTYAGGEAQLGQLTPERLIDEFRFREISARSAVYGLVGAPAGHSVSPAMHNAAFRAAGLDAVYVPFEAADADDFLRVAAPLGVQGASVTIPFKRDFLDRVQEADGPARTAGAVNTLKRTAHGWAGTNTDIAGFLAPLTGRLALDGARVAIAGAGGAARALAVALRGTGAHVSVHARRAAEAGPVAALAAGTVGPWPLPPGTWDVLVNATPVGMVPNVDGSPVPAGALTGRLVYDLVYNPPATRLLREAAGAGCDVIGGLDMLVAQARAQFRWWTGREPDERVMRQAAVSRLGHDAAAAGMATGA